MGCEWCIHNPYSPNCDLDQTCDFKNLPYEKKAILERLNSEKENIDAAKKKLIDSKMTDLKVIAEEEVHSILDATKGMQIMIDRLVADFGMTEKELKDYLSIEKDSFITRAKLAAKLGTLKMKRRKK